MQRNNLTSVQEMLEQLPTEELRVLLDRELHTESVNDNSVRLILNILKERQKDLQVDVTPAMEEAWGNYQRETDKIWKRSARSRRIRSWALRAASMAAVLVLLIAVLPQQAGAQMLWERMMRWTDSFLEFFGPNDNVQTLEYEFDTDNPGLQQVYATVVEMGVTEPVVPMWIPEGYELVECRIASTPAKESLMTSFAAGQKNLVFNVDVYKTEVSRKYQKNDADVEVYELNETEFLIMKNIDLWTVVWAVDKIECSFSIECQEDSLYEILKSIYVRRMNT